MNRFSYAALIAVGVLAAASAARAAPSDPMLSRLKSIGTAAGFTYGVASETKTFGGHTVTLTTTASDLSTAFENGTGNLTVVVDGTQLYSGATRGFTDADGQKVLDALAIGTVRDRASTQVMRTEVQVLTRQLSNRLAQALAPSRPRGDGRVAFDQANGIAGVSAGDGVNALGVWTSASNTFLNNYDTATKSDGMAETLVLGADYRMGNLVLGMAGTGENVDMDTTFNGGTFTQRGGSIGPYAAYGLFDGAVIVDAFANWGSARSHYKQPLANTNVSADYTTSRTILGSHLSHAGQFGQWDHLERVGYTYSRQRDPSYTQSDNVRFGSSVGRVGEWTASGKLGYTMGDFHPYGELSYIRDTMMTQTRVGTNSAQPSNDKDEVGLALGMDYRINDGMLLGVQVNHGFFREHENNTSFVLDFRAEW
ncbi:MAG: autotransporter outer membrane beta-barrel domain-containing protein [Bacteroidales bacterium]